LGAATSHIAVIATKKIQIGEELTIDYGNAPQPGLCHAAGHREF
jgi:hypothetical protein